jgi:uncharacterized membrane protein
MWLFILISTGSKLMFAGLIVIFVGAIVYFIKAKVQKEWPFVYLNMQKSESGKMKV